MAIDTSSVDTDMTEEVLINVPSRKAGVTCDIVETEGDTVDGARNRPIPISNLPLQTSLKYDEFVETPQKYSSTMKDDREYNNNSSDSQNQNEHLLRIPHRQEQRLQQPSANLPSSSSSASSSPSKALRNTTFSPSHFISLLRSWFLICLRVAIKHYCITVFVIIALVVVAFTSSRYRDPPPYILTSLYPLEMFDSLGGREAGNFELVSKGSIPRNPPLSRKLALVAIPVGLKAKDNVAKLIKQINTTDPLDNNPYFSFMFFHYDDSSWQDFPNYDRIVSIRSLNQSKFWFAKRFLQPETVQNYDYIVLWDDDIALSDSFDLADLLKYLKKYHIHFAQPALTSGTSHNPQRNLVKHHENEEQGRFTNFVEIMVPIVSTSAWSCAWRLIPYDVKSAWGLDYMWYPACASQGFCRFAVLDKYTIVHMDQKSFDRSVRSHVREMSSYVEMGRRICQRPANKEEASSSASYFSSSSAASAWATLSSYYSYTTEYKVPGMGDDTTIHDTDSASDVLQSSDSSSFPTSTNASSNFNTTTDSSSSSSNAFEGFHSPQIHIPVNPLNLPNTPALSTFCSQWNPPSTLYNIRPLQQSDTETDKSIHDDGGACPDPFFRERGIRNLAWWGQDVNKKDKRTTGYWAGREKEAEEKKAKDKLNNKKNVKPKRPWRN
ncbi:hypothetical protein BKA69DRAFT_1173517 [Paraphysoderma sedebokerense]|nr:hypothetical protein BKA69DRAFT_1173517 [Paraphysoderma sedebokerense]